MLCFSPFVIIVTTFQIICEYITYHVCNSVKACFTYLECMELTRGIAQQTVTVSCVQILCCTTQYLFRSQWLALHLP
ncbi:hypothetical protein BDR06DRAFT_527220 [Suillus hirtellus]|nr:hypothetical protein BDR06DRAFT_527220 [Suillus hirtellus]